MAFSSGAVLTAAQLNDFAPGTRVQVPNGTEGAPSVTFTSDTDTGMYRVTTDQPAIVAGGTLRYSPTPTTTLMRGPAQLNHLFYLTADSTAPTGTQGDVAIYFGDLDDTAQAGIYWDESAKQLTLRGYNNQLAVTITGDEQCGFETGTAALPSITFTGDLNTGFYQQSSNDGLISWTSNGTLGGSLGPAIRGVDGSASTPTFSFLTDTNTGLYLASSASGTMRMCVQGTNIVQVATSNVSPVPTNAIQLGLTGARWQELWAVDITSTNAATTDSDMRLKDPAGESLGLDFVTKLSPFAGRWKDDTRGKGLHQWLSAQNVAEALEDEGINPADTSMWLEDEDGSQRLAYGELIPVLIRAVQELAEKVDA